MKDNSSINDATLTLTDGTYEEDMQSYQSGEFGGTGEHARTYTLIATASGYQSRTIERIVVTADACHVHGAHIDVQLFPH